MNYNYLLKRTIKYTDSKSPHLGCFVGINIYKVLKNNKL